MDGEHRGVEVAGHDVGSEVAALDSPVGRSQAGFCLRSLAELVTGVHHADPFHVNEVAAAEHGLVAQGLLHEHHEFGSAQLLRPGRSRCVPRPRSRSGSRRSSRRR